MEKFMREFDDFENRNPLIIPKEEKRRVSCPKCDSEEFTGRKVMGVVTFICKNKECKNEWQGGLPREPLDPTVPYMPESHIPVTQYVKGKNSEVVEILQPVNKVPAFRGGLPIPEDPSEGDY